CFLKRSATGRTGRNMLLCCYIRCGLLLVGEYIKTTFQKATWATSFGRVDWNFRAALWANSDYADHHRKVARALPLFYCVKFYQRLRPVPQKSDRAARLQRRRALRRCGRSPLAITFDNNNETGEKPV